MLSSLCMEGLEELLVVMFRSAPPLLPQPPGVPTLLSLPPPPIPQPEGPLQIANVATCSPNLTSLTVCQVCHDSSWPRFLPQPRMPSPGTMVHSSSCFGLLLKGYLCPKAEGVGSPQLLELCESRQPTSHQGTVAKLLSSLL